jgi:hypothetical protein
MEPPPNHILNTDITFIVLFQTLKKLQRNKVAGLDGMKAEFILDVGELLHISLLTTFNCFFEEGFLEALSTRVVHALFKRGDAWKFDNYRGITVGPILPKLFAMILEKRLRECVEQHGLHAKGQTGFRKYYRTTNQLFILRTLIKQSKAKKKPLYYILQKGVLSQPYFEGSVRSPLTLSKMGLENPVGLLKIQSSIARVKTLCFEVFFIFLERS